MAEESYRHLLSDPRWQRRKSEIMQRDNFTCRRCGCTTKTLNVHHLHYIPGRMPWEYDDEALITLCEDCHAKEHNKTPIKVGKFYSICHSDYQNEMVCYHIDYKNRIVYLFGVDFGDYANGYIYIEPFDRVSNCSESDIIPDDLSVERDEYSLSSLYYAYADLLNDKADVYGMQLYNERSIINFAKEEVKKIFDANPVLSSIFNDYNEREGRI